jgi:hypothetical protein
MEEQDEIDRKNEEELDSTSLRKLIEKSALSVDEKLVHRLIFSYLIYGCYEESAKVFYESCIKYNISTNTDPFYSLDWFQDAFIKERTVLRRLIAEGYIEKAYTNAQKLIPVLFDVEKRKESSLLNNVYFRLQCQRFVEKVREGNVIEALCFAQDELSWFYELNQIEIIQDHIVLLAYRDPASSPVGGLLSQEKREAVADALNTAIIGKRKKRRRGFITLIEFELTMYVICIKQNITACQCTRHWNEL